MSDLKISELPLATAVGDADEIVINVDGTPVVTSRATLQTAFYDVMTVTVIYDAGWPATRPNVATVLAVGGTTAPAWLTADDVWFEVVS